MHTDPKTSPDLAETAQGVVVSGGDERGQVDQLGVLAPRPDGDLDMSAWAQKCGLSDEDAGEPG